MTQAAFVYTELQISAPFADVPWQGINDRIRQQPGFINKTWLAGVGTHSVGGIYAFATLDDARSFVRDYFPGEAKSFGVAQSTKIFDATATEAASVDMKSAHYGLYRSGPPAAFVYTEVQVGLDFADVPWERLNPVLRSQPGLTSKTWLSGVNTRTAGGFYSFDDLARAQAFAQDYFPTEAAEMNAAYTTRVFDAQVVAEASRAMHSPFFGA